MNSKVIDYTAKLKLSLIQFIIISLLIVTFPYNISNSWVGTLSILSFIIVLFQKSFNFQKLLKEHTIVALFIFIFFTYLSALWSDISFFEKNSDFNTSFDRFKYYFFLVPSIYFSKFSQEEIKRLFLLIALSSLPLIIIYYLNGLNLIDYHSQHYGGVSSILRADLQENIFIVFTSIYIYTYFLYSLKDRKIFKSLLLFMLLIFTSFALIVDPLTNSRMSTMTFLLIVIIGPAYVFGKKYLIILPIVFLFTTFYLLQEKSFVNGINNFKIAIYENKFQSSWGHRVAYSMVGIKIFSKDPILGSGINDITSQIIEYKKINPEYFIGEELMSRLHNDHLLLLAQTGIVGYLLFLYFIYLLIKINFPNRELHTYKNLFILSFFILMAGEHYMTDQYSTNLWAINISLFILYKKYNKPTKINEIKVIQA